MRLSAATNWPGVVDREDDVEAVVSRMVQFDRHACDGLNLSPGLTVDDAICPYRELHPGLA
jgi:hypothetical protein